MISASQPLRFDVLAVSARFVVALALLAGCGGDDASGGDGAGASPSGGSPKGGSSSSSGGRGSPNGGSSSLNGGGGSPSAGSGSSNSGGTVIEGEGPPAGNPEGKCAVPAEARAEDSSKPDHVVGTGTKASCTSRAFVDAVAQGGVITFDCGDDPVTIVLEETAKVFNDKGPKIVIDGGGLVTLSGGGKHRILYQDTCNRDQVWTTSHCNDQDHPQLTVQNLTLVDGNAKGADPDGGGAIYAKGGRLKIVNCRFFNNVCDDTGPDVGGAAVRAFQQSGGLPVYVVNSTFGGEEKLGNVCSNGGGLSSIGVSYTVINSLFSYNRAIGHGANPAQSGTPGGGSGGAIYNDGNTFTLSLCGTRIEHNVANEGGGAVFFVSNDRSGSLLIRDSTLRDNESKEFETDGYPGIFVLAKGMPMVTNSTLEE